MKIEIIQSLSKRAKEVGEWDYGYAVCMYGEQGYLYLGKPLHNWLPAHNHYTKRIFDGNHKLFKRVYESVSGESGSQKA